MATLLVLHWRGTTINTMTLAGLVIALGAVVDDAIIDVENIVRRLREERARGGTQPTARWSSRHRLEVRSPIIYATLIIVVASVPVLPPRRPDGGFFRPLALSYTLAIVASLLVALTLTRPWRYFSCVAGHCGAAAHRSCDGCTATTRTCSAGSSCARGPPTRPSPS